MKTIPSHSINGDTGPFTGHDDSLGTMMWIGERFSDEFVEAYRFCETRVAQIAARASLADAFLRPATQVDRIVLAQSLRVSLAAEVIERLVTTYRQASCLQLRGSLCTGEVRLRHAMLRQHEWYEWNQVLPSWLGVGSHRPRREHPITSVAVVANSLSIADPLLELAAFEGLTAVWCREPDPIAVRGIGAVWWDESVATPCDSAQWQARLAAFGSDASRCQHVWLTASPDRVAMADARAGGIDTVISKPFKIESLTDGLRSERCFSTATSPIPSPLAA